MIKGWLSAHLFLDMLWISSLQRCTIRLKGTYFSRSICHYLVIHLPKINIEWGFPIKIYFSISHVSIKYV